MEEQNLVGPLLKITAKYIDHHVSSKAEQFDLTAGQLHILHYICVNADNGVVQKDIEARFELTHATVSGIVKRLESKNFVVVKPTLSDKRYKSIFPTDKALECDNEMRRNIEMCEMKFFSGFTTEEKSELCNMLLRILSNLGINMPNVFKEEKKC